MNAGAGQYGADGELSVGHIEMELVATPDELGALTALLDAVVAELRQVFQHALQLLFALALDACAVVGKLTAFCWSFGTFADSAFLGCFLLCRRCLGAGGQRFPHWNRRGITGNVSDETFGLSSGDHRFVQLLR